MKRTIVSVAACCLLIVGCLLAAAQLLKAAEGKADKGPPADPKPGMEYTNPKDGSVLVWIPGGEFTMGRDDGDADEKPAHKIKVKGFWLGKFEVTNAQYGEFIKAQDHRESMFWNSEGFKDPRQPVVGMSWQDAKSYVDYAGLRLSTEIEWEYAARGGKQLKYPTSTGEISHDLANYRGVGGKDTWDEAPAPIGKFPPNPFGLFDMAGNAWEWTSSYHKAYPYATGDGEDAGSSSGLRVMRGGSWHFSEYYATSTHRRRFSSHLEYDYVGIRVALSEGGLTTTDDGDEGEE